MQVKRSRNPITNEMDVQIRMSELEVLAMQKLIVVALAAIAVAAEDTAGMTKEEVIEMMSMSINANYFFTALDAE